MATTGVLKFAIEFDDKGTAKIKNAKGKVVQLENQVKKSTSKMKGQFGGLWKQVAGGQIAFNLLRRAVLSLGRALKGAFVTAANFEKEMANVSTLVDTSVTNMDKMSLGVLRLAGDLGSAQELTKGLYQALSAGVDPAKGIDFVAEAAKFAKAGLTDMFSAVDAMTTAINAYGMEVTEAGKVSDIFFEVIKKGKITGQQLASSIGLVISTAAQVDVSLEEVGAAIASMTKVGIPASRAMISLNQAFIGIIKPTQGALDIAEKYGITLSRVGVIAAGGFQKWLIKVKEAMGDNASAMAELFPNIRALRALFSLTGKAAGEYKEILEGMNDVTGNTNEAFKKQINTAAGAASMIENKLSAAFTEALLPALQDFASFIRENESEIVKFFTDVANAVAAVAEGFIKFGGIAIKGIQILDDAISPMGGALKTIADEVGRIAKAEKEASEDTEILAKKFFDFAKAAGLTHKEVNSLLEVYKIGRTPMGKYSSLLADITDGTLTSGKASLDFKKVLAGLNKQAKKTGEEGLKKVNDELAKFKKMQEADIDFVDRWFDSGPALERFTNEMKDYGKELDKILDKEDKLTDITKVLSDEIKRTVKPFEDAAKATKKLAEEKEKLSQKNERLRKALQFTLDQVLAFADALGANGEVMTALENFGNLAISALTGDIMGAIAGFGALLADAWGTIFGESDAEMKRRQAEADKQLKAMRENMKAQAGSGIDEFTRFLNLRFGKFRDELQKVRDELAKGDISVKKRKLLLTKEQFISDKLAESIKNELDSIINITLLSFAELARQGLSLPEIFLKLGDNFDLIRDALKATGQEGNETINKLLEFQQFTKVNKDLLDSITALSNAMEGMASGGMIKTQEAFDDFQKLAIGNFDKLIEAGATEEQALLAMLPTLRILNDLQKKHNFELDENIQKQIDLANQDGLLDQIDPMKEMVRLLGLLVDHFVGLAESISVAAGEMKVLGTETQALKDINNVVEGKTPNEDNIIQMPPKVPGFARGANFIIPPGFEKDNFLMRGKSGEEVNITPAGQSSTKIGDINLNITFTGGIDERTGVKLGNEIADIVNDIIKDNIGEVRTTVREAANE